MTDRPRIAVDAMGGDGGPAVTVPAALAMSHRADVVLVGDTQAIRAAFPGDAPELSIRHAAQALASGDTLADALRHRPDSSMRQALKLQAEGEVDAVVSAGDTAALMALARSVMDMVPGVERPAILKDLQGVAGPFWMLDLGANIDCTPQQLHQFARLGAVAARFVGGIDSPRVALLNIGTESRKGPRAVREAAALLLADSGIDYVGFIEGNELFTGRADVVVADGFAGNVALKSIEGTARMAGHLVRNWLDSLNVVEQAGLALARSKLESLRHELNPQRYNGASFVGLAGVVIKSHGSADTEGFRSAIEEAVLEVEGRVPLRVAAEFAGHP